jgi:hypothetical protein
MSAMGNLLLEIQEFVDPLVYMGATNETILEQFDDLYKGSPNYSYMRSIIEEQITSRQFLREG